LSKNRDFYALLEPVGSLSKGVRSISHTPIPDDWYVVCADVKGSTQAIRDGRYRAVNAVGAAIIMAVLNVDRSISLPYVFEGDGAMVATPPELYEGVKGALAGAKNLAKTRFGLELAAGVISAAQIRSQGAELSIAKVKRSHMTFQAAFSGTGWRVAEKTIKNNEFCVGDDTPPTADFTGFQCRWEEIPARSDHKLSLIVNSTSVDQNQRDQFYSDFMTFRDSVLGSSGDSHPSWHPLHEENLKLIISPMGIMTEATFNTQGGLFVRFAYSIKAMIENIIGIFLFAKKMDTKKVEWSRYVGDLIANSDYEKYSSSLMMVLDVSNHQADTIENYLIDARKSGDCIYGLHRSPTAVITCYVRQHNDDHVHFVDGGGGGYAAASIGYKAQAEALTRLQ
jgi:hypothetical protein